MTINKTITNNYNPKRHAVKLNKKAEQAVVNGHPWVFASSIIKLKTNAKTGDLAIIFSNAKNNVIGIGLFDFNSPIQIKLLHSGSKKATINSEFFFSKIKIAYKKRTPLLKTKTNSYRLIFGENDGFPSLIADVYANVLVVKLYSEIWLPYLNSILKSLQEISKTHAVVIRLSRQLQKSKNHQLKDGQVVFGTLKNEVVNFVEHGIHFNANVIKGHKTGYFLDHRHNRKQVGFWSNCKTVLDVFAYAGGFSVHALSNNASAVTSVDISRQALELAKANAALNSFSGTHNTIAGDAFKILNNLIEDNKQFDVVVIDPPSFAKQQSEIALAKKKYAQLALLGAQLTAKNGLLVLASCSSRVTAQSFFDLNHQNLKQTHRAFKTVLKTQHDIDHPVTFTEGAYLKCGYYRFLN